MESINLCSSASLEYAPRSNATLASYCLFRIMATLTSSVILYWFRMPLMTNFWILAGSRSKLLIPTTNTKSSFSGLPKKSKINRNQQVIEIEKSAQSLLSVLAKMNLGEFHPCQVIKFRSILYGSLTKQRFCVALEWKQINQHESFQELSKIIQKDFTKIIES